MALSMQRIRWPKWRQLTHPRNAKDCLIPHARTKERKNWMKNETEQSKPKPKPETEPGFRSRSRSAPGMPCNSSHIRCQPGKLTQLFTQVSLSLPLSKLSFEFEQMLWCCLSLWQRLDPFQVPRSFSLWAADLQKAKLCLADLDFKSLWYRIRKITPLAT